MIRHLSKEHKRKISLANKGKSSPSTCFKKGNVPWNKGKKTGVVPKTAFKKGIVPWIKGRTHSIEVRKKISEKKKGYFKKQKINLSNGEIERRKKISLIHKNKVITDETRKKQSISLKIAMNHPEIKRKISKSKEGEKNPMWAGGKSFEPYSLNFNKQFKIIIKKRDGYICQKCSLSQEDILKKYGRKLVVHHIDYDKKNTSQENCITLCPVCNTTVNKNRNFWTNHFNQLLNNNYKNIMNQKTILDFKYSF